MNSRRKIAIIGVVLLVAALAIGGLSFALRKPVGLADWDAVMRVAEDMLQRGDAKALLAHTDTTGMPLGQRMKTEAALRSWQGIPKTLKLDNVEVVDPKDFKYHEGMSEEMAKFLGTPKWSRPPEKMIVYRYSGAEGASARWYFGVFQDHGNWYFSACYPDP